MVRRKIIPVFNGFFIFVDLHRPGCSLGSMYCGRRLYSFFRYWIIECGFYFNLNICKDFVKFIAGLLVIAIYLSGFSDYFNFHFFVVTLTNLCLWGVKFDGCLICSCFLPLVLMLNFSPQHRNFILLVHLFVQSILLFIWCFAFKTLNTSKWRGWNTISTSWCWERKSYRDNCFDDKISNIEVEYLSIIVQVLWSACLINWYFRFQERMTENFYTWTILVICWNL